MNVISDTFGKLTAPLFGTGIGKLPGVWDLYQALWKMYRPDSNVPVKVQGMYMYLDKNDFIMAPQLFSTGYWEKCETLTFKKYVKPSMTVVDIGANIGYYSLIASRMVSDKGQVISFEPMPATFNLLQKNIELNQLLNIVTHRLAVTDRNGTIKLHIDNRSPASNSVSGNGHYIEVESVTLDDLLAGTVVNVIKMDIEGSEARALRGMVGIIENNPGLVLFTEVCDRKLKSAGSSMEDYVIKLHDFFEIQVIDERKKQLITCRNPEEVARCAKYKTMINLVCRRRE